MTLTNNAPTSQVPREARPLLLDAANRKAEAAIVVIAGIDDAKQFVTDCLADFDSSSGVNEFFINDVPLWFDKQTRASLAYTVSVYLKERALGSVSLWAPSGEIVVPPAVAAGWLDALEVYAKTSYDVTQAHKIAINRLETMDEVLSYDIRAHYPAKLRFKTQEGGAQ